MVESERATANPVNHDKLPGSKWTAARPTNKEKHFIVHDWELDERGNRTGRVEIKADAWVHTVLHFGKLFHRVAGKVQSILTATQRAGQKWLRGKPNARRVFG